MCAITTWCCTGIRIFQQIGRAFTPVNGNLTIFKGAVHIYHKVVCRHFEDLARS